jgi:hypothetical protein
MFGRHVFLVNISFCKFPLYRSISLSPGSGLALSRVVGEDSNLMAACREGKIFEVRKLFRTGKARPDDVTERNMTPLLVCIKAFLKFSVDAEFLN